MTNSTKTRPAGGRGEDIIYPSVVPYILFHLACFGALLTGVTWRSVVICAALYVVRIFAIGAGYHRYFSHRAFKTSRAFQLVLAILAQSSAQKSVLWWAAKHRHHHLHSDTEDDVHSPRHMGFWYAHVGWIFARKHDKSDLAKVPDLAKFPELMWLDRFELVPPIALGAIIFMLAGWPGFVVGFVWSTVLVYQATLCINSLAHVQGKKRYVTGDDSRNNWLLAIFTMGEGWHNNHHAYQTSARQGFRWWEIDLTFYVLKGLSRLGIVWDLRQPPVALLRNEQRLGSKIIERAAAELAGTFQFDHITAAISNALAAAPGFIDLAAILTTRDKAIDFLSGLNIPAIPTQEALRERAAAMFARTKSLEAIAERAHHLVIDAIRARLATVALA